MQTTEMYTRADPSVKLEALESVIAPKMRSGRFKATDRLIASLSPALLCGPKNHQNDSKSGASEEGLRIKINSALQLLCCEQHNN